jgi:hypothetical protein
VHRFHQNFQVYPAQWCPMSLYCMFWWRYAANFWRNGTKSCLGSMQCYCFPKGLFWRIQDLQFPIWT